MIVKKVRREIVDKPKTWQIGDLVDYIRFPHNHLFLGFRLPAYPAP